jgi:hypothetical protein
MVGTRQSSHVATYLNQFQDEITELYVDDYKQYLVDIGIKSVTNRRPRLAATTIIQRRSSIEPARSPQHPHSFPLERYDPVVDP